MKKYVCLLLTALLLLAAACAGAENAVGSLDLNTPGVIQLHTEANEYTYKYVYKINLIFTGSDGQNIKNQAMDLCLSGSGAEIKNKLSIVPGGQLGRMNVLRTDENGSLTLYLPVLDNNGTDFFAGFPGKSVFIWAKYAGEADENYSVKGELIRLPSPPTVASMEAMFSQNDSPAVQEQPVQCTIVAHKWTHQLEVQINDGKGAPYSGIVHVEVSGQAISPSPLAQNGLVLINIPDVMYQPGARVTLKDVNQTYIGVVEVPDNSPKEPAPEGIMEQPQQPTAAPTIAYENTLNEIDEVDSAAVQKGGLLKGWNETLVGIVAVVCLVIYLACWLLLKFPDKFGLNNQGKGV